MMNLRLSFLQSTQTQESPQITPFFKHLQNYFKHLDLWQVQPSFDLTFNNGFLEDTTLFLSDKPKNLYYVFFSSILTNISFSRLPIPLIFIISLFSSLMF
jgi:hypothetical protein